MWYAARAEAKDPDTLAVALEDVKTRLLVDHTDDDADISDMIREATAHVESYCNIRLAPQVLTCECDSFRDFRRLPDGPVFPGAVKKIEYTDGSGVVQNLDLDIVGLRLDGLEAFIALKPGWAWPVTRFGERIIVTIEAGYPEKIPYEMRAAILHRVASNYQRRENAAAGQWSEFDSLLVNYRRGL